jgi:hypothetical protein
MVEIESELFSKLIIERSLRHPTARNFNAQQWLDAANSLCDRTERDVQLLTAALHYGHEIAGLRARFEQELFAKLDQRTGILLSITMANYNYVIADNKAHQAAKPRRHGIVDINFPTKITIGGPYPGNQATPDTVIATIVDTLPHCLERAINLPQQASLANVSFWEAGKTIFSVLSIEHSLRDLWQQVLWEGWVLREDGQNMRHDPGDRELATWWEVWSWRHEMILAQGTKLDSIFEKIMSSDRAAEPYLKKTVVGIGGKNKHTRRFRFGALSGRVRAQAWHKTEITILEESYLAQFLDSSLPTTSDSLTCRELFKAWCVIRDCADILNSRSEDQNFQNIDAIEAGALIVRRDELIRSVSECVEVSLDKATAIVNFFTCDLKNLSALFIRGLWSVPLVAIDNEENIVIARAPLAIGSAIRRIEGWLERGGLSDHLSDARRGVKYESWVRATISAKLAKNRFLPNARCANEDVVSEGEIGEQIDLMVRLGTLLIVGEVKCRLYPIESTERHNYLKGMNSAGDLPLNFHPAAVRASANVTPFGAVSVPA